MLVIDAANVIGSRSTGWWRDRLGAARRFTEQVRATVTAGRLDPPVTVVLEGQARSGADKSDLDGVAVVHAPGEGIPKELRDALGIDGGTEVEFERRGSSIVVRKAKPGPMRGHQLADRLRGRDDVAMTTDEIMAFTRGN
jgi:AbrB family looped-hinge helix DNA binding protein